MTKSSTPISQMVESHKKFFASGRTKPINSRIHHLKQLERLITENRDLVCNALKKDLNKSAPEAEFTEIRETLRETRYAVHRLKKWTKPKRVSTPLALKPGTSHIMPEPLGTVLIISPWNYPFSLLLIPLAGAIAAGNTVVLKPSEIASETSKLLAELVPQYFEPDFISVVQGGVDETSALLEEAFDHIFFTGSEKVGKIVMKSAAEHLTSVTLELGGKSPCIVDKDVDAKIAAKRIAWGKFLNAGQTCVAPDYILVQEEIKDTITSAIREQINRFYGDDPKLSDSYCRIINESHYSRLTGFLQDGNIVCGGDTNPEQRYISPTILDNVNLDSDVMTEEIFGPILPLVPYKTTQDAVDFVNKRPKPLALYAFSNDRGFRDHILQNTSSGGACINDTILQITSPEMPFGGVGKSGMGSYHGKWSFDTFSHYKSILKKPFKLDMFLRYPPFKPLLKYISRIV